MKNHLIVVKTSIGRYIFMVIGSLAVMALFSLALAQGTAPTEADALTDLARTGIKAAADRKWGLAVSAIVYGLVVLARWLGGKFWPVLTSNRAGALLGLAASLLGGLVAAFKAGEPVDVNLVAAILGVWWTTAGGQTTIKDIFWGSWEPKKNGNAEKPAA